jgi:hypothetical protein
MCNCECCRKYKAQLTDREHEFCRGTSGLPRWKEEWLLENAGRSHSFTVHPSSQVPHYEPIRAVSKFVGALSKHLAAGMPYVSDEDYKLRLSVCEPCKYRTTDWQCSLCGCNLRSDQNKLLAKAWWHGETCPTGYWPEPTGIGSYGIAMSTGVIPPCCGQKQS